MWPRTHHEHDASAPVLLAVLSTEGDRRILARLCSDNGWALELAADLDEALAKILATQIGVVIVDRDLAEPDWRTIVRSFTWQHPQPCVILASPVSDHYLFEEVIHQGGYDVVSKPLKVEEVCRITRLALTFWKSRLPRVGTGS